MKKEAIKLLLFQLRSLIRLPSSLQLRHYRRRHWYHYCDLEFNSSKDSEPAVTIDDLIDERREKLGVETDKAKDEDSS